MQCELFKHFTYVTYYLTYIIGNRRSLETKWKLEVVEVFNNFNRWKEETSVLLEEMKNYLNYYYQHLIPLLDRDIAGMLRTYVRTYVCMYMYVCMYVRMYVCVYVCMYVTMYVCMYVRMYV